MTQYYINTKYKSLDRYDMAKFLEFDVDGYTVTNSEFLDELKSVPSVGSYQVVGETEMPWLIAFNVYGDSALFWVILYYNDLQSEGGILQGTVIEYPSLTLVDRLFFGLKAKQTKNT